MRKKANTVTDTDGRDIGIRLGIRQRASALRGCWFVLCFLTSISFSSAVTEAASCKAPLEIARMRAEHLEVLNRLRGRHSLETLTENAALDAVAQDFACLLVMSDTFSHVGPDGSKLPDRLRSGKVSYCVATENLALGQASVLEAMAGWVKSPGHHRNLTNTDVRLAGLGIVALEQADAVDGKAPASQPEASLERYMWVQVFTAPCGP